MKFDTIVNINGSVDTSYSTVEELLKEIEDLLNDMNINIKITKIN